MARGEDDAEVRRVDRGAGAAAEALPDLEEDDAVPAGVDAGRVTYFPERRACRRGGSGSPKGRGAKPDLGPSRGKGALPGAVERWISTGLASRILAGVQNWRASRVTEACVGTVPVDERPKAAPAVGEDKVRAIASGRTETASAR